MNQTRMLKCMYLINLMCQNMNLLVRYRGCIGRATGRRGVVGEEPVGLEGLNTHRQTLLIRVIFNQICLCLFC